MENFYVMCILPQMKKYCTSLAKKCKLKQWDRSLYPSSISSGHGWLWKRWMSSRTQGDQPPRSLLGGGKAMPSSQRAGGLKCFDIVICLSRAYSKESISTQTENMKLTAYICIHCMLEGQKGVTKGWQPGGVSQRQKAQWARQSIELKGARHPYPSSWKKKWHAKRCFLAEIRNDPAIRCRRNWKEKV